MADQGAGRPMRVLIEGHANPNLRNVPDRIQEVLTQAGHVCVRAGCDEYPQTPSHDMHEVVRRKGYDYIIRPFGEGELLVTPLSEEAGKRMSLEHVCRQLGTWTVYLPAICLDVL